MDGVSVWGYEEVFKFLVIIDDLHVFTQMPLISRMNNLQNERNLRAP
jgi:hypothetical protein